jgi:hypothetical protein
MVTEESAATCKRAAGFLPTRRAAVVVVATTEALPDRPA